MQPNRLMGAEMAIVRLCHVADQPPPGELLAKLQSGASIIAGNKGTAVEGASTKAPTAQLAKQVGGQDLENNPLALLCKI